MPSIIVGFYLNSMQSAIKCVKGESHCYWRKKIPDVKTVTQYSIALEEAVPNLLQAKNDEYIVELLDDAKRNKKWPKNYESFMVEQCLIGDQKAKGKFIIGDELKIYIDFSLLKVRIYPSHFENEKIKNAKDDDINKLLNKTVLARMNELQEILKKLQKIKES